MVNILMKNDLDGGDISVNRNGIEAGDYLHTAVFACLFGGNREADSRSAYLRFEQNLSYWGNIFLPRQFNSQTERAIRENIINDAGKSEIRKAVFMDLQKLIPGEITKITQVYVSTASDNDKKIEIVIFFETQNTHKRLSFEV